MFARRLFFMMAKPVKKSPVFPAQIQITSSTAATGKQCKTEFFL